MNTPTASASVTSSPSRRGSARMQRPQRRQVEWQQASLDELVPADHRVRIVWQFVETLDLTPLYELIRAVEGEPGRDPIDPQILLALWLYATIEGIGSARKLDDLRTRDVVYRWLCGGVGVNYHTLSDFRTAHADLLERLLVDGVAALLHQGLVTLDCVTQDGMKVRAAAGKSSFRRRETLEKCRDKAQRHLEEVKRQAEEDPAAADRQRQAARERAARQREERIAEARKEMAKLEQKNQKQDAAPRVSTTDPEARVMKMADGGFRPAYNLQLNVDAGTRLIVGVEATNQGNDWGLMDPQHEQVTRDYGRTPDKYLVDGGYPSQDELATLEQRGTTVYAPIHAEQSLRKKGEDPHLPRRGDNESMIRFRQRMGTEEAKEIYKQRSSIAEFPHAEFRNRGLQQLRVRGKQKAKAIALWYALAFNLLRMITLKWVPQVAATG